MIVAVILLVLTRYTVRIATDVLHRMLRPLHLRQSLEEVFVRLITILMWIIGILVASAVVFPSITPAKILAALGFGSIAIGFAFRDIFENFLAGILIMWGFPFEVGDYIECQGIEGQIEDINIRNTTIRQTDGQLVIVPNADLFKNPVIVRTSQRVRRTTIICGVAYSEDVDESREVIRKTVEKCKTVNSSKPVQVFAQEFAESSISFEVTWWTGSKPVDIRESRDEVVAAVKRALDQAGIEIPFPYRTLTFKEPLKLGKEAGAEEEG
ncbi:mechanosensitive ion channel family protein [bacterium]|nr:mechanosensitive ion channel family protein [bacterium]